MRIVFSSLLAVALTASVAFTQAPPAAGGAKGKAPAAPGMALSSPDFQDGGIIPDKFTQAAAMPVSPKLEWTNVPATAAAFVLIMHDPDNALNKTPDDVLHWMAFNIPGSARSLAGGQSADATLPDGTIQAKNQRGTPGFLGPGNAAINPYHHYTWELFALDAKLTLGPDATRADVMKAMETHIVGKAVLSARFKRPQ
ncbi:MAG: YbhB/YbcL family Raf kinase inhibitor-like protein [Acidobacteriota bacterium]